MKTILLFGSGESAKSYVKNNMDYKINAVVDNNKSVWGHKFFGYEIIAPFDIKKFDFDYIVIASIYTGEIIDQLVNMLDIERSKIIIPPKRILKPHYPFSNLKERKKAKKLIKAISKSAIDNDVNLFLDFGALLGLIRNNDLIEWDDDIDFSLVVDDLSDYISWFDNVKKIMPNLYDYEFGSYTNNNDIIKFFIKVFKDDMNLFTISFRHLKLSKDFFIDMSNMGLWKSPALHFMDNEHFMLDNQVVCIPKNPKKYLTYLYGDWKVENKNFTFNDYMFLK